MLRFPKTIYTVRPGDSLYQIARMYGLSVQEIININGIVGNTIYPGQRLIIPIGIYSVQSGDSLYKLAQKFNTTIESFMVLNNLTSTFLRIGQRLQVPQYSEATINVDMANIRKGPGTNFPIITVMVRGAKLPVSNSSGNWYEVELFDGTRGWISKSIVEFNVYGSNLPITTILGFYTLEEGPTLPSSYESFINNTGEISELGLFMFRIDANNPTEIEKFGEFTNEYAENLVRIAHENNIKILPVIHNLLYRRGDVTVSKDTVKAMVATPQTRAAFIQNVVELIEGYGFDGVNMDIEDVYLEDSTRLSAFYTELGRALHQRGYFLSASVPSRVSDRPFNPFSDPFQYAPIGAAVDEFVVMLYNEHGWPGSGPGPVVSIGWMDRVLKYTMTKMPRDKTVAAVSVFGFDFNLTTGRNTYVTHSMAVNRARQYNAEIIFDEATQTPMYSYTDAQGNKHEVWFEDDRSIKAKVQRAWDLGIKGIALWRLGMEDPKMWTMLRNEVVVRK
ncbi:MAG: LysM peptidoglycan-binding domain-containing protein [Epulopiscium sp.]|nr:LysM peptidoglycan-binding domain-containing protein [Candidatus Epulonipiscium sp.]